LAEIWNRLRLPGRLLPGDQLRVRLLTASPFLTGIGLGPV
jgi:hypothetical protein